MMCVAGSRLWPATRAKLAFMFCHIVGPNTAGVTQRGNLLGNCPMTDLLRAVTYDGTMTDTIFTVVLATVGLAQAHPNKPFGASFLVLGLCPRGGGGSLEPTTTIVHIHV